MQVEKDGCTKRSSPGRGETEEAEADDRGQDETGGRERRRQGQTAEGRGGAGRGGGEGREPPQRDRSCWIEKTELETRATPRVHQRGYSPAGGGNAEGGLEAKDEEGNVKERN